MAAKHKRTPRGAHNSIPKVKPKEPKRPADPEGDAYRAGVQPRPAAPGAGPNIDPSE